MRMEQYLTHTDYALWEIARRNELKSKSNLLLAIPDEHLLKFHRNKDAKTLCEAIKTMFGGNKESMKIQKTILKQQYENFAASRSEGRCKFEVAEKSTTSLEHSHLDHVAFVSSANTSSTNEAVNTAHDVSTASSQGQAFTFTYVDDVMFPSLLINLIVYSWTMKIWSRLILINLRRWISNGSPLNERDLNNKSDVFESASDSSVNESEEDNNQANDRNFVPTAVITNSGKVSVNTAKQSSPRAAASTSTARYINTAATRPTVNDTREVQITATIDGKAKLVSEASIRRHLKLKDSDGISTLPNTEMFEQLALMGVKDQQFQLSPITSLDALTTSET
nr:ribonuclease H-like domain-containing protein [Tanacetum cinerariifolium]GEY18181.1 ribonuclease H-like domain-containing protein [Tanacetum cinerariifolium]